MTIRKVKAYSKVYDLPAFTHTRVGEAASHRKEIPHSGSQSSSV